MTVISDNLIHFLARADKGSPRKQFEIFKLIIQDGLRTAEVRSKFSDGSGVRNHAICFTDIPLSDCDEHTSIYGKFGIGFKKSYVKQAGGNPARYFVNYMPGEAFESYESRGALYYGLCEQNLFIRDLNNRLSADSTFELVDREGTVILDSKRIKKLIDESVFISGFEKEMGDLGPARDETREIDLYYKEREWRLVPCGLSYSSRAAILSPNATHVSYKFSRTDVHVIVVPNEEMRTTVLEYFLLLRESNDIRLSEFGHNVLPVVNYDDLQRW